MTSNITKKYKTLASIFTILIYSIWLIVLGFYIISGLVRAGNAEPAEGLGKELISLFYPLCISYIVAIILTIFVTQKIKTLGWMVAVVLASYLYGNLCMYITFGIWIIDEYILTPLQKHYKNLATINKEIDKRL